MMLRMYGLLIALLSPFVALALLPFERGRTRLQERFGFWKLGCRTPLIWFHGASLGEVRGMLSVIKGIKERFSDYEILLTSTSSTGLEAGAEFVDHVRLLPFDSMIFYKLALRNLNLRIFVLTETELWPSLLGYLMSRQVPAVMINARISDMTKSRYAYLRPFFAPLMQVFSKIMVSQAESLESFEALGATGISLQVVGNSKYDAVVVVDRDVRQKFRESLGFSEDVYTLCLGSIRDGEEDLWFTVYEQLRSAKSDLQLIVAPRHKEKFEYFANALQSRGIDFVRWSELDCKEPKSSVVLLDTYGKLLEAYAIASRAFIGATLVDVGGHNPLEAAAQGCPVVVGPFVQNIKSEISDLCAAQAAQIINTPYEALALVQSDLESDTVTSAAGQRAAVVWQRHQGSTVKLVHEISSLLQCS